MNSKTEKIYPDSGVELKPFTAKNYDNVMNIATLGLYRGFIHRVIEAMDIQRGDKILDLGLWYRTQCMHYGKIPD